MPSRSELKKISLTRLKEVKILYNANYFDGARYLSGYVIETALKARICRILNDNYPDSGEISRSFLTHKLENLIKLGGLQKAFDEECLTNIDFKTNWSVATTWSESFRYHSIGTNSQAQVQDIIEAIEHQTNGVLTWIKRKW